MITGTQRCRAVILALGLMAVASACALKTDPITPPSPRPEQVKNVHVSTRDAVAYLSWQIPARNVEGIALKPADILLFRVYRADFGRDRKKARYKLYAEIPLAGLAPSANRNGVFFWSDTQVKYGYIYGYRVRAVSVRGGVSSPSEEVRVTPLLGPAAPAGVRALGGDGFSLITWETVTAWIDGSPYTGYVGYNVYRGTERGSYDEAPLNKEPLTAASYKDGGAVNNRTYYYIVRSVNSPAQPWKESPDSEEVSATPKDLTPPARPTGLSAVPGVGRVFLTWNENKEPDLAGYHVYRSTKPGRDYERLTDKLLLRTTFSDETVKAGGVYYYVLTAVDQSGNESEYSHELKVTVERFGGDSFLTTKPKGTTHQR
jgi:hypothetical protein